MRIYTYATHSQGLFEDLRENGFHEVRVVGFGSKWKGFMDKFSGIHDAIVADDVPDEEIVVFLDGFDSRIRLDPQLAVEKYEKGFPDRPVLVSRHGNMFSSTPLREMEAYALQKIFLGELNSGMYMGPAKRIRAMLSECLQTNASDDQRAINMVKNSGNVHIVVDQNDTIFENLSYEKRGPKCTSGETNAAFVSCPGELSVDRYRRAVYEYVPYLWKEILLLVLLLLIMIVMFFRLLRTH